MLWATETYIKISDWNANHAGKEWMGQGQEGAAMSREEMQMRSPW
jgi:hypothetical protein